ncbi:MAG: hypothetical protein RLZZ242_1279 [Bacteroidota bacterium]
MIQREVLLRVNYMAVLLCAATAIKFALEASFTPFFYIALAFSVLFFINAKALKPTKHV